MSTPEPLSYDCSKYVIRYLDPNLRFTLSQRCPSLTTIERITPLRMHTLEFQPDYFKINNVIYTIGVIQVYNNGKTPTFVRNRNLEGGVTTDVDRYGISVTEEGDGQEQVRRYKGTKSMYDKQRTTLAMQLHTYQDWERLERVREQIEECELNILPYTLRQENAEPPFAHYLQLLIKNNNVVRYEKFSYDKTILGAKEYLLNTFFGRKERTVKVAMLNIGVKQLSESHNRPLYRFRQFHIDQPLVNFPIPSPLLPLAPGKLKVQNMEVMVRLDQVLNSVKPIIWNEPLKSLMSRVSNIVGEHRQDPLIATAKRLVLVGTSEIQILSGYSNENVHLESCFFDKKLVETLFERWQMVGVGIGRSYSIGVWDEMKIEGFLSIFKQLPGAERKELTKTEHTKFLECVIVPVHEYVDLNIFCEETSVEDQMFCKEKYIMKIRVQPRGHT